MVQRIRIRYHSHGESIVAVVKPLVKVLLYELYKCHFISTVANRQKVMTVHL